MNYELNVQILNENNINVRAVEIGLTFFNDLTADEIDELVQRLVKLAQKPVKQRTLSGPLQAFKKSNTGEKLWTDTTHGGGGKKSPLMQKLNLPKQDETNELSI